MWNGTIFIDLDWPLNASSLLSASAELLVGRTLWPISTIVRGFYTSNYHALVFYIWRDSLHRLQSYCWETACRSFPGINLCTLWKNCIGLKNDLHLFNSQNFLYHHAKFGGDRTMHASCRCENVVFVFSVCHAPKPVRCAFEGNIVWSSVVSRCISRFWCCLHRFFRRDSPFRYAREFAFPLPFGATIFVKLRTKLAKSPKISRKFCVHHFI